MFNADQTIDGSPEYIRDEMIADRIRLAFPGQKLKIIVILREPVMRAYSHYQMELRMGNIHVILFLFVFFKPSTRHFKYLLGVEWDDVRVNNTA